MSFPEANGEKANVDLSNSARVVEGWKAPNQATTSTTGLDFPLSTKIDAESPTDMTRKTELMGWKGDTLKPGTTPTNLNPPQDPSLSMYDPYRQVSAGTSERTGSIPHSKRTFSWKSFSTPKSSIMMIGKTATAALASLLKPKKRVGDTPTAAQSLRAIVFASWLNILLVFIPVSWALHFAINDDTVIFVTAFLAIIPLAKLLGFATEELSLRVGETLGGLLNATLGNAVELIISIIALTKCQLRVVQASLIGSILSNLLLVLGMCFFAGGTKFASQCFLVSAAQLNSSLLTLSVVAVIIPATFFTAVSGTNTTDLGTLSSQDEGERILKMSRGVAVVLLFIYGCNLVYQLRSNAHLYDNKTIGNARPSQRFPATLDKPSLGHFVDHIKEHHRKSKEGLVEGGVFTHSDSQHDGQHSSVESEPNLHVPAQSSLDDGRAGPRAIEVAPMDAPNAGLDPLHGEDDEEEEYPQISVWAASVLLVAVTVLIAFTAEFLVDSLNGLVEHSPLSQEWVGLILLPIVGNAAEHVTAVSVSVKDKLDLSIGVAVGSSIQIALLVIPFSVILAWILGKPLTLLFDPFEAVVLFLTVTTVNYIVADGQSNWLKGMILMCLYVVIAVAFWSYPGVDPAAQLLTCV